MATTDSAEKTLVINAWNGITVSGNDVTATYLGKTLGTDKDAADRANLFKWEVVSNPNGILRMAK